MVCLINKTGLLCDKVCKSESSKVLPVCQVAGQKPVLSLSGRICTMSIFSGQCYNPNDDWSVTDSVRGVLNCHGYR
ncbi:hypothetical protein BGI33_05425 [Snodgrassella alvi]|nr:hypothetical protein BGI33_05425 [Snodgrassella alvi]PIT18034.1 hypothetical protein BGI34_06065 [Snodgrassella alvi]